MNRINSTTMTIVFLAAAASMTCRVLADTYNSTEHFMTIAGTSTLHDWKTPVNTVVAHGDFTLRNGEFICANNLSVTCAVRSIKSDHEGMDEKIYDALKADEFPNIVYSLSGARWQRTVDDNWRGEATGSLTVAGVTKQVDMSVSITVNRDGSLRCTGTKKLAMTMFHVDPPTAMFGVIRSGDEITIAFDITLRRP